MASYDKKGWKRQIKATLLGNIAGDLATSLIKSPFEEPRQRFLIHDQAGRELDRQYKGLATEQAKNAVTRQTIQGSKLEDLAWFQKKNFDAMKAQLGEQYQGYEEDVFVQNGMGALREEANRLGQIEHDEFIASENKLRLLPDRATFNARVDRYTPRSKNWGQALFRAGKRFVKKQSYEEYADNSIRSIIDGTGIDFTDEEITKIRRLGLQARRPVNKEGVLDAVKAVLNIDEVKEGMEQAQRQKRHGLAVMADRLTLQDQKLNGTMDPTFMRAYNTLDAERLGADKTTAPTTTEVLALIRKNFKDSFVANDSVTRTNMKNEWMGQSEVQGYYEEMLDSHSIYKTQDTNEEGGVIFSELRDKSDQEAVVESADDIFDRVYSVARDRTLVQLQGAYDAGTIPRDYLGGTPAARMLQKQLIFKNANDILLGSLEKGVTEEAVINKNVAWWDSTEAREYITGAIVGPTSEEFIQEAINNVDPSATQDPLPAVSAADAEDKEDEEDTTTTAAVVTAPQVSGPAKELEDIKRDRGHFPNKQDRIAAERRSNNNGRNLIQRAVGSKDLSTADEQWDYAMSAIQEFEKDADLRFNPFKITPSSEGSGFGTARKEPVKFNMPVSPFVTEDVDQSFAGGDEHEEFRITIDSKNGKVDLNFQGTATSKPSGWTISKLTPANNINIDDITDPSIFNHLRYMAEAYDKASPEDQLSIIGNIDFGYSDKEVGHIVGGQDTALVKDLLTQFLTEDEEEPNSLLVP